ncbi:MAG: AAA family ATPase [Muribaculum sp.]|nr:AAA family ATPase [Muribaculum sp.]
MEEIVRLIEPVIEPSLANKIVNSILSEPIVYVQQNHYSYFRRALLNLIEDSYISKALQIQKTQLLEFDMVRGLFGENGEKLADSPSITRFIADLVEGQSELIDNIRDYRILVCYGALSSIVEDKKCVSELVTFANDYFDGKFDNRTTIFIVENYPCSLIPQNLSSYISLIDTPFPDKKTIEEILNKICISKSIITTEEKSFRDKFSCLFKGLHQSQIISILNNVLPKTGWLLSHITYKLCEREKKRMIKKTNVLELIDSDVCLDDIGGLDTLKEDIRVKSVVFKNLSIASSPVARIPIPKGILILGMPGCGKSMIAKAIANEFDIPLLRLDIGRLMGKYVGESEENLRIALNTAEASHPCILWIDEVEKAFAGNNNGGNGDSLVVRLMGSFLTWMQERQNPVYIIATANDAMRPEFMRRGRFDEVYFVNFPNQNESVEIIKSKISIYNRKDSIFDFQGLNEESILEIAKSMQTGKYGGFAGAEIEAIVNSVVEHAFITYINSGRNQRILIKKAEFISEINKMQPSIMANQVGTNGVKSTIERILDLQKSFCFKSASK